MKALALFTISILIFGAISPLIDDAFAQNDPYILLKIAQQADKQIQNQLDRVYGNSIPDEIQELYEEGHATVKSLENSLQTDLEQAKVDFLKAMKLFKQISKTASQLTTESKSMESDGSDRDLKSELNRLHKYFLNLKVISQKYDTGINFSEIEKLFTQATNHINSGEISAAIETINQLELLIDDIKKNIREHASYSATERAKEFLLKQINKIKAILEKADSDNSKIDEAFSLVDEIENSIYEDKISDAKKKFAKLIKLVKMIEKSNR